MMVASSRCNTEMALRPCPSVLPRSLWRSVLGAASARRRLRPPVHRRGCWRKRRDGKEGAAQPQRQIAHAKADDPGNYAADQHQHRNGHLIEFIFGNELV